MRRNRVGLVALALLGVASGCASTEGVRYVYQDGEFGVVGLPENTDHWPTHYRRQAEKLMAAHFPEGHEIVRAEEVIEGERTVKLEGSRTAEVAPSLPAPAGTVGKLGRTTNRSQADTLKVKECRIIYKRDGGPNDKPAGYAEAAALTPTLYVDPNAAERRKANGEAPGSSDAPKKDEKAAQAKTEDKGD